MKLHWLTDIHINFLSEDLRIAAGKTLAEGADAVLISGDISESNTLDKHLKQFTSKIKVPVYFVLGNHDFYNGSIQATKNIASQFPGYLDKLGVVELTKDTCLIGCLSWYDTRVGTPHTSNVRLNDFYVIKDFSKIKNINQLITKIKLEADKETENAERLLEEAAQSKYGNIFFMTHIPPFQKVHLDPFRNQGSNHWAPWFVNERLGIVLTRIVNKYPHKHFTVLCGHTHTGTELQITNNLNVIVGSAQYNNPTIAKVIVVSNTTV